MNAERGHRVCDGDLNAGASRCAGRSPLNLKLAT
jgi:hypothetical protein